MRLDHMKNSLVIMLHTNLYIVLTIIVQTLLEYWEQLSDGVHIIFDDF